MKPLRFLGRSRQDLQEFPATARREAGFQLDHVQYGLNPDDWKPMKTIGSGVREIRIKDKAGAFRVIYVATFADAVYVLHAFQKKTQATSLQDIRLATSRFRELAEEQNL
jgi:phage-related protein